MEVMKTHFLKPVLIFKSLGIVSAAQDVCPAVTTVTSTVDLVFNSSFWVILIVFTLVCILSTLVCIRKRYGENFFRLLEKAPDVYISVTALKNARPGISNECYHYHNKCQYTNLVRCPQTSVFRPCLSCEGHKLREDLRRREDEYDITIRVPQPTGNRTTVLVTEAARPDQEANLVFSPDIEEWIARSMRETAQAQEVQIPQNHEVNEPEAESEEGHFDAAMNRNLAEREALSSRAERIDFFRRMATHERERQLHQLEEQGNLVLHRVFSREHALLQGLSNTHRLQRRARVNQLQALRRERDLLIRERLQLIEHNSDSAEEPDEYVGEPPIRVPTNATIQRWMREPVTQPTLTRESTPERAPVPEPMIPIERQRELIVRYFQDCEPGEVTRYWMFLASNFQGATGSYEAFETLMNELHSEMD